MVDNSQMRLVGRVEGMMVRCLKRSGQLLEMVFGYSIVYWISMTSLEY